MERKKNWYNIHFKYVLRKACFFQHIFAQQRVLTNTQSNVSQKYEAFKMTTYKLEVNVFPSHVKANASILSPLLHMAYLGNTYISKTFTIPNSNQLHNLCTQDVNDTNQVISRHLYYKFSHSFKIQMLD